MDHSDLNPVWKTWLKLFHKLHKGPYRNQLAGPFFSVPLPGYYDWAGPKILYVGQATGKRWNRERRSWTVAGTREYTSCFLENHARRGYRKGLFWPFARKLSNRIAATPQNADLLPNLVWTNICKIGTVKGNPPRTIREAQRRLAQITLCLEIEVYRPNLVVFVTGDFEANEVIKKLIPHWEKERKYGGVGWRAAKGKMPAMLWTYHPQGKRLEWRRGWLELAEGLVHNGRPLKRREAHG